MLRLKRHKSQPQELTVQNVQIPQPLHVSSIPVQFEPLQIPKQVISYPTYSWKFLVGKISDIIKNVAYNFNIFGKNNDGTPILMYYEYNKTGIRVLFVNNVAFDELPSDLTEKITKFCKTAKLPLAPSAEYNKIRNVNDSYLAIFLTIQSIQNLGVDVSSIYNGDWEFSLKLLTSIPQNFLIILLKLYSQAIRNYKDYKIRWSFAADQTKADLTVCSFNDIPSTTFEIGFQWGVANDIDKCSTGIKQVYNTYVNQLQSYKQTPSLIAAHLGFLSNNIIFEKYLFELYCFKNKDTIIANIQPFSKLSTEIGNIHAAVTLILNNDENIVYLGVVNGGNEEWSKDPILNVQLDIKGDIIVRGLNDRLPIRTNKLAQIRSGQWKPNN
jgi:hypothetical protein